MAYTFFRSGRGSMIYWHENSKTLAEAHFAATLACSKAGNIPPGPIETTDLHPSRLATVPNGAWRV